MIQQMPGRRLRKLIFPVFVLAVYLFLLAPILMIIPVSFSKAAFIVFPPRGLSLRWYENFLMTPALTDALLLSLRLGVSVTFATTTLGTLTSAALVRYRFFGQQGLRNLIVAPMVLPAVVLGLGFLIFFNRVHLFLTFWSLFLAHSLVTLPYVVRTVTATMQGFEMALEEAAASLGANPFRMFLTVTLPLIKPGVIAGAIFAFITSFDEFVISLFLSGPRLSTLPVEIYNYIEFTSDPTIAAISVVLIVFTVSIVLIMERFIGFTRFF